MLLGLTLLCEVIFIILYSLGMYFADKRDEAHDKRMLFVGSRHQTEDYVFWNKKWGKYARYTLRYLKGSIIIAIIGLILVIGGGVQQSVKKLKKGDKAQPSHVTHHNTERVDMTEAFEEQEKLMWIEIRDKKR